MNAELRGEKSLKMTSRRLDGALVLYIRTTGSRRPHTGGKWRPGLGELILGTRSNYVNELQIIRS